MKKLVLLSAALASVMALTACDEYTDSISEYCATQRKLAPTDIEPLPQIQAFVPLKFEPKTDRMPFVLPKPEISQPAANKPVNCEQPDRERPMEELEQYSLDNLFMRGTIMMDNKLRALIQTADGSVVRVVPGMHMGLNFGKVISVAPDAVEVEEFISDGNGCWNKKTSRVDLIEAE